jgi:hypothetical protein
MVAVLPASVKREQAHSHIKRHAIIVERNLSEKGNRGGKAAFDE